MATFKKWFVNGSILLAVIYIFGIYLDLSKEVFVSNFFYSPILQFLLILSLLATLVIVDSHHRKEKKDRAQQNEGLLYVNHKNFSVDVNLLRDHFDDMMERESSVSFSNVDIYKENGVYFFNFLIFLKKDTVVALESLTARLTAQVDFLLQDKFGNDFPGNVHVRYANEKEPFPTLDTVAPKQENEPIEIPENIGRQLFPTQDEPQTETFSPQEETTVEEVVPSETETIEPTKEDNKQDDPDKKQK